VIAWRVRRRSAAGNAPSLLALIEVLLAHVARIADDAAAAAALRGHAALLQRPVIEAAAVPVIVATGAPGSGKTTAVMAAARRFQSAGGRLAGFVQPARMSGERKTGFDVRDLATGEAELFAEDVGKRQGDFGTRFRFRKEGFALAARALGRARGGDLLVVDEMGPLELRGQGHLRAVQRALRTPGLRGAVIVVRRQLVPALLAELDADDAEVVEVTAEGGEQALDAALRKRGQTSFPRKTSLT
jgi:nucleoside-triphosphatase